MSINVGFDLDGVLVDSNVIFQTLIYKKFKTYNFKLYDDKGNERFTYHINGVERVKLWNCIHDGLLHCQPFMLPTDGMAKTVYKVWNLQNREPIVIITARPDDCVTETIAWLNENFPVPYDLHMVEPPKNGMGGKEKNTIVDAFELTHFVEDRFKYASDIARETDVEKVFLINKPYNRGRRVSNKVERIDWLSEVPKILTT